MPLHLTPGKVQWEADLHYQCQHYQNILIQPPHGDEAEKLMAMAEAILKEQKFVRCEDRSEKLWHNDLVTYQKESAVPLVMV